MTKKIVSKVRDEFLSKYIFRFYTPSKTITVYISNKKGEFFNFFTTVLESYSKSFMQKNWQKIDSKSPWE
jgi:hypothetical protein